MIVTGHGCLKKCVTGCWLRTYSFTWTMGGRLDLPRTFSGKPLEARAQHVTCWLYMTTPDRSNLHNRLRGHGLAPLPVLRERCMGWCIKRGGIRLGV